MYVYVCGVFVDTHKDIKWVRFVRLRHRMYVDGMVFLVLLQVRAYCIVLQFLLATLYSLIAAVVVY